MEWDLQQQGFDFCYDKRLYDRIMAVIRWPRGPISAPTSPTSAASCASSKITTNLASLARLPQAPNALPPWPSPAFPGPPCGMRGSSRDAGSGFPVFLQRRPDEAPDLRLSAWYHSLLAVGRRARRPTRPWRLLDVTGWADNQTCHNLLAWSWSGGPRNDRFVVVVNLSGAGSPGTRTPRVAGPPLPPMAVRGPDSGGQLRTRRR